MLTIGDRDFYEKIAERGKMYYEQGKVRELEKINDSLYIAKVEGTEIYKVSVNMENHYCKSGSCTCPFNAIDEVYINPKPCKHMYAVYLAIYEIENKECLKNRILQYTEEYSDRYKRINVLFDYLILSTDDKNLYENYKAYFNELIENITNLNFNILNAEQIMNLLCSYINESARILDLLNEIRERSKNKYSSELEEKSNDELEETVKDEENRKVPFIIKFFDGMGAFLNGFFGGLSGIYDSRDNDSEEFSIGDMVRVKYSGKVGVIVSIERVNYYMVKFNNEFEKEYFENYHGNELEIY